MAGHRNDRVLAESVCESIFATTPSSRHRVPTPRISAPTVVSWAIVAVLAFISLAVAGAIGQ